MTSTYAAPLTIRTISNVPRLLALYGLSNTETRNYRIDPSPLQRDLNGNSGGIMPAQGTPWDIIIREIKDVLTQVLRYLKGVSSAEDEMAI
ncbi:hypothetical protein KM043_004152 [Ampulex compressa]|nr:hypothetical protein KM043_004152 [Ampulex compressa]